jgi:hypothetical protein
MTTESSPGLADRIKEKKVFEKAIPVPDPAAWGQPPDE